MTNTSLDDFEDQDSEESEPDPVEDVSSGSICRLSFNKADYLLNSDQSRFEDFTGEDTTFIAAVRHPDDVPAFSDQHIPDFGMPWAMRNEFRHMREEYVDMDGMTEYNAHDRAWGDRNIQDRFEKYCWWDASDTQSEYYIREDDCQIKKFAGKVAVRVMDGENIALMCECSEDQPCHVDIVIGEIHSQIDIGKSVEEAKNEDIEPKSGSLREVLGLPLKTELTDF